MPEGSAGGQQKVCMLGEALMATADLEDVSTLLIAKNSSVVTSMKRCWPVTTRTTLWQKSCVSDEDKLLSEE